MRALALAADLAFLYIGAATGAQVAGGEGHNLAYAIVGSLLAGSVVHALGVVAWNGALAWTARAVGSILVGAALVVPTVLTIALPLVGLQALTLWSRPETRHRDAG